MDAFVEAIHICLVDWEGRAIRYMDQARGAPDPTFEQAMKNATLQMASAHGNLSRLQAGNIAEVEIIGLMMGSYRVYFDSLRTAERLWEVWKEEPDDLLLRNVFNQFISTEDGTAMLDRIIKTFPWSVGGCSVEPSYIDALVDLSDRVTNMGEARADPKDADYISTRHGRHVQFAKPALEAAVQDGWWPLALHMGAIMRWDLRYWENIDAPLPDPEEMLEMIDEHRRQGRNLMTEKELKWAKTRAEEYLMGGFNDESDARLVLSLDAFRYDNQAIHCPGCARYR